MNPINLPELGVTIQPEPYHVRFSPNAVSGLTPREPPEWVPITIAGPAPEDPPELNPTTTLEQMEITPSVLQLQEGMSRTGRFMHAIQILCYQLDQISPHWLSKLDLKDAQIVAGVLEFIQHKAPSIIENVRKECCKLAASKARSEWQGYKRAGWGYERGFYKSEPVYGRSKPAPHKPDPYNQLVLEFPTIAIRKAYLEVLGPISLSKKGTKKLMRQAREILRCKSEKAGLKVAESSGWCFGETENDKERNMTRFREAVSKNRNLQTQEL